MYKSPICSKCGSAKPPYGRRCFVCKPAKPRAGAPRKWKKTKKLQQANNVRTQRFRVRQRNLALQMTGDLFRRIYSLLEQDVTTGQIVIYEDQLKEWLEVKHLIPEVLNQMQKAFQIQAPPGKPGKAYDPFPPSP